MQDSLTQTPVDPGRGLDRKRAPLFDNSNRENLPQVIQPPPSPFSVNCGTLPCAPVRYAEPRFVIDGIVTEYKGLTAAGPTTVKNAIEKAAQQGKDIIIEARRVGLSAANALQQIQRAQGNIGGLQGRVTVLTKEGPVKF